MLTSSLKVSIKPRKPGALKSRIESA